MLADTYRKCTEFRHFHVFSSAKSHFFYLLCTRLLSFMIFSRGINLQIQCCCYSTQVIWLVFKVYAFQVVLGSACRWFISSLEFVTLFWLKISFTLVITSVYSHIFYPFPLPYCSYISSRFFGCSHTFLTPLSSSFPPCVGVLSLVPSNYTSSNISWADRSHLWNLINTALLSEPRGKTQRTQTKKRERDELKRKYLSYYTSNTSTYTHAACFSLYFSWAKWERG